ncbi:MAG TPA: thioesterase family protein [Candidatus Kapabacteria bacterium]|nr:thioesterase family protein [Candidatus Kapabacteria bacterium]
MSELMFEHVAEIRVRYADTDKMGVVYYGKYFEYFEVARTEMLREYGLPYADLEATGVMLPVSEASAKYYRGAKYDDLLRITCRMPHRASPKLEITYEVRRGAESDVLAEGRTTLVFVDEATGKPVRPPKMYLDRVEHFLDQKKVD